MFEYNERVYIANLGLLNSLGLSPTEQGTCISYTTHSVDIPSTDTCEIFFEKLGRRVRSYASDFARTPDPELIMLEEIVKEREKLKDNTTNEFHTWLENIA